MHLKHRYGEDEMRFMQLLRNQGSISCQIFTELRLSREVTKSALKRLHSLRKHQVTLSNIICATRYKSLDENGQIIPTLCPLCREAEEALEHMIQCTRVKELPITANELVDFLSDLAPAVCRGNPGLPIPLVLPTGWDVEFSMDDTLTEGRINLSASEESSVSTQTSSGVVVVRRN